METRKETRDLAMRYAEKCQKPNDMYYKAWLRLLMDWNGEHYKEDEIDSGDWYVEGENGEWRFVGIWIDDYHFPFAEYKEAYNEGVL